MSVHEHAETRTEASSRLQIFSPAGVVRSAAALKLAARRLKQLGFAVEIDESALARHQRFAGDDETRLAAIHRVAAARPSIAMLTRGGYGLTRLLDRIEWKRIRRLQALRPHCNVCPLVCALTAQRMTLQDSPFRSG